ncbi:MAG: hypothetical protein AB7J35_17240 [Dehalococcoidia bacterium]
MPLPSDPAPESARERKPGEAILDDLADQLERTRRLLTSNPTSMADEALSRFGGEAENEARIAADFAAPGPLEKPERFLDAHRLALRALEILDREGARGASVSAPLGPLKPLVQRTIDVLVEYIVKSFALSTVSAMQRLYVRREPQAPRGTPERAHLAQARVETDRVASGFKGGGVGVPVLVAGGAALPALASASQYLGAIDFLSRPVIISIFVGLFILFGALSWVLLKAASIAHRRSELIMRQPLAALWETVGHCGDPPTDDSQLFAVIAILLSAVVWVLIPVAGVVVYVVS